MLDSSILHELAENIGDPILVFAASDASLVLANRAAADFTGVEDPVSLSMKCHHFFCSRDEPCDEAEDPCPVRTVLSSRASIRIVRSIRDGRGRRARLSMAASPVLSEAGTVEKVVVSVGGASPGSSRRSRPARGRTVGGREGTGSLLTDILGHDLLNPATVIRYCADTLREGERDPRRVLLWRMLDKNLSWLVRIVDNTALLSRLDRTGRIELRPTDLRALFRSVAENLETGWRDKGIEVSLPSGPPCLARASPMVEDAFANVFSNAVRHTPAGGSISVSFAEEGDRWVVKVSDTGPGIPDDAKERVFDPYERLGLSTSRGQGLGLAITRRIMKIHEGSAWVEDAPGGGTLLCLAFSKGGLP